MVWTSLWYICDMTDPNPPESGAPERAAETPALSVGFILLPNFTLTPFAGFIDVLRLAADEGDFSNQVHCRWSVIGRSRDPVKASCGVAVTPFEDFPDPVQFDYIVVCGGLLHRGPPTDPETLDYLKAAAAKGVTLVGICVGSFALAWAGLLDRKRCCVSWFHRTDLMREFPDVIPVADQLYVADGRRITCAGGAGAIDLAGWIVERHLGPARAQKAMHILVVDRVRPPNSPQPMPPSVTEVGNEKVRRAILLIEQNLSEPLEVAEIARRVHLSQRQLERLFAAELDMSPRTFLKRFRLNHALWLLTNTRRRVTEIAQECGFSDASHFSRQFRAEYGSTPLEARRANAGARPETGELSGKLTGEAARSPAS